MAGNRALSARDGEVAAGCGASGRTPSPRHLRAVRAYAVAATPPHGVLSRPRGVDMVQPVARQGAGSPPPLRLTARGRRALGVLLLLVTVGMAAGGAAVLRSGAEDLELMGTSSVVVEPGDTLWSIASRVAGERDVREVIDGIWLLNGLDSAAIQPGQVLGLPGATGR